VKSRLWALALTLTLALGMTAFPVEAADRDREKGDKQMQGWAAFPAADEWRFHPEPGAKGAVFIHAVMRCAVADTGELSNCRIIRETPVNSGMGPALLALAPKFRRKPPGPKDLRQIDIVNGWSDFDKHGDWLRRPTPEDLRAVFPVEALKRGISGSATIACAVTVQGALTDCAVTEEFPAGQGFGGAAIALTPQFLMRPATRAGVPVPSLIHLPINFKTDGPADVITAKRVAPANLAWAEAPTYADVAAAYPAKARASRIGGRATVACNMTGEGRLKNCETLTASPRNQGFEAAAKALALRFRLEVASDQEKAAKNIIVHLPVTFDPAMLDQASPVVGKPNWAELPKADEILAAFDTLKVNSTVRAQLRCVVQPGGYLGGCQVASEQPTGSGAGQVALTLAPRFRLTTWTSEGLPTIGGVVVIPIRYEPGGASPPAS